MAKTNLTAERLREVLHYDPDTGVFTWRSDLKTGYNNNALLHKAGDIAGCKDNIGRFKISIDSCNYYSHRLAWLYIIGEWPTNSIDHINGNNGDNRFCNLRDVLPRINSQNLRKPTKANTSGYLGVTRHKKTRWRAVIRLPNGTRLYSYHDTAEAAYAAYLAAKRKYHDGNTI